MPGTFEPAPSPGARRVATYARVSSDDQAERGTIATQVDLLEERIAVTTGISIVGRFSDDGVSGTIPLAERPDGRRLMALAADGAIDELWVYKVDRLGRDAVDLLRLRRILCGLGVRIVSMVEGEQQGLPYDIQAVVASYAREEFLRRSADGIERAAREGRYPGGIRTYGYQIQGEKGKARPVPDERLVSGDRTAAGVVRHIYRRVALDHWSCRQVADELNDLGIPTLYAREERGVRGRRTTGRWGDGRIRNMLVNPTYKGVLTFGKRSKRPRALITAPVEPLVSEELWQAAQGVLASHRIAARNTDRVYLLRGLMTCRHCGQRLVGSTNNDTTYYRCGGKRRGRGTLGGRCFGRDVKGDAIEQLVWADVERWLREPGDILDELDGRSERQEAEARRTEQRAAVTTAMAKLDGDMSRLVVLAINGSLTEAELRTHRAQIADERAVLQARLDTLEPVSEPAPIGEDSPRTAAVPARHRADGRGTLGDRKPARHRHRGRHDHPAEQAQAHHRAGLISVPRGSSPDSHGQA